MSTLKVDTINTSDGSGNITFSRPTVLTAGDIVEADILDLNVTTAKVADNAITLAKMAGGTDGQIITYDASGDPVAVGPGTDGQVLTSTGAGSPPAFEAAAGGGKILQVVNVENGAVATGTTVIAFDDTIWQNTEGVAFSALDLAITPANASNKLLIQVVVNFDHTVTAIQGCAIFQDTTANALAVGTTWDQQTAGSGNQFFLNHYMAAGTTSSTTFKVRVGSDNPGTVTFNGTSSARKFGGVMASSMTIWEIAV